MKTLHLLFFLSSFFLTQNLNAQDQKNDIFQNLPKLKGPYLGQKTPSNKAQLFANGIVATGLYTRDMAITPDGKEIYYCISSLGYNLIFYSKLMNCHKITDCRNTKLL